MITTAHTTSALTWDLAKWEVVRIAHHFEMTTACLCDLAHAQCLIQKNRKIDEDGGICWHRRSEADLPAFHDVLVHADEFATTARGKIVPEVVTYSVGPR
jgi:hypothetical protein